jgi:hypothetical protein
MMNPTKSPAVLCAFVLLAACGNVFAGEEEQPATRPSSGGSAGSEEREGAEGTGTAPVTKIQGSSLRQVLRPGDIPAIDNPKFVKAAEADFMSDGEPILGIDQSDPPKAYSLFYLEHHEIVNDVIGDSPVAATW